MRLRLALIAWQVAAGMSMSPLVACASAQDAPKSPKTVTTSDLSREPERFAGEEVKVTGRLTSEGNYFSRARRIMLVGEDGERIDVTPWLPLSSPPPRRDSEKQPATLADYLDQTVELHGVLQRPAADKGSADGAKYKFTVKSARILTP